MRPSACRIASSESFQPWLRRPAGERFSYVRNPLPGWHASSDHSTARSAASRNRRRRLSLPVQCQSSLSASTNIAGVVWLP
jgi:hypothetical protein